MTLRRVVDVAVAATGLCLAWPLMLLVSVGLLLADGRPVLFIQDRSGRYGRPFRLVKFRTMSDARDAAGVLLPDAQRITRTGRLLRVTRIDELPQLWNVLIGEMSLIGPRPLLPATIAEAGEAGRVRGRIRPGVNGWAQVSGNTLLSDSEKIALDTWYIGNRSLVLDLRIVVRTLLVSLRGERRDMAAIGRAHAGAAHRRG